MTPKNTQGRQRANLAISTDNSCSFCAHSHTAPAKVRGRTEAQHAELLSVIGVAAQTNHLVTTMQIPVDPEHPIRAVCVRLLGFICDPPDSHVRQTTTGVSQSCDKNAYGVELNTKSPEAGRMVVKISGGIVAPA